ncbi:MAG: division/cell wall cluster transcriptional repressor MraZ [Moraxellaceae bacterium]|nr:division/cell wall cluster transcriptional repressor MraZ [Moraxellaceae bacterium]MDZ4298756.1 division/cell wall cluster transcriptional repressor MraZ [Moraxellaceae bacterium]MDZ4386808.1 division/cell wall cluster transcriptional repressor MraZ [Moraxellaceae bacterium]
MFRGYDELTMDVKGRVGLPARYHDRVIADCQGRFVLTVDLRESCLTLYPLPEWEAIEARFNALPGANPAIAMLKRRILGYATEVSLDATGRFLISPELRQFAKLEKHVVLTGQGKKCEIWQKSAWDAMQAQLLDADFSAAELAQAIDDLAL